VNTNIISVREGTKVDEVLANYFSPYMKSALPVLNRRVDDNNDSFLVGMVTLKQAMDVPEYKRQEINVEEIMIPKDSLIVMEPNRKADEALMQMTRRHMGKVFICEENGRFLGLISKTDIMNVVHERQEYIQTIKK
jgi:predicted transcriptional regulator